MKSPETCRRELRLAVVGAVFAVVLAACSSPRPSTSAGGSQDGGSAATGYDLATCTACHGTPGVNAAPPAAVKGAAATSSLAVGAHQQHLRGLTTRTPLTCDECHVMPASVDAPGHIDKDHADVVFDSPGSSGLARMNGAKPVWDRTTATCSGVYCHGAKVAGGAATAPVWTTVDGSQRQCGSCHGFPPPAPHPNRQDCSLCHSDTVDASNAIDIASGKHINGSIDVSAGACSGCHGDASRATAVAVNKAAPPVGTHGETDTTAVAVGAHQQHLNDSSLRQAVACSDCHVVPTDLSHVNGVVELTFGALASNGTTPSWNPATATCSNTYCHGGTLAGGSNTAPVWTRVDGSQAACGTCHGVPPPSPHPPVAPDVTKCATCHPATVDANGAILVAGGKHIDGNVDVLSAHPAGWSDPTQHGYAANRDLASCKTCHGADLAGGSVGVACAQCHNGPTAFTCTFCHGTRGATTLAEAAPPVGTQGETMTTDLGVGAHRQHLTDSALRPAIACTDCHAVPTTLLHSNGSVDFAWSANLAAANGASPRFDTTTGTCASTYCHGATLNAGGLNTAPVWTQVGRSQAACGMCHGIPPPASTGHPQNVNCGACHPGYSGGVNLALHIDGKVDISASACSACHGDSTRQAVPGSDAKVAAAPPVTATGASPGAHLAHVNDPNGIGSSAAMACANCHAVVDTTHPDGRIDVVFGSVAVSGGAAPSYATLTCSNTYCHGNFPKYGLNATMRWTDTGTATCGTCHGIPPAAATGHPQNANCGSCHDGYTSTTVNTSLHVNGAMDVKPLTCTSCHGDSARTAIAGADANVKAAPPVDVDGTTTGPGVGAHLPHVNDATSISSPLACALCHNPVPTSTAHSNGTINVTFSGRAINSSGAAPSWNGTSCANIYCHGNFTGRSDPLYGYPAVGGKNAAPGWGDGPVTCTSCHDNPPADHLTPQNGASIAWVNHSGCSTCHPGVNGTGTAMVDTSQHVNGTVDLLCAQCH